MDEHPTWYACAPIFPTFFPLFRLYEVVSLHMCFLPYMYRKILEMLPKLIKLCRIPHHSNFSSHFPLYVVITVTPGRIFSHTHTVQFCECCPTGQVMRTTTTGCRRVRAVSVQQSRRGGCRSVQREGTARTDRPNQSRGP